MRCFLVPLILASAALGNKKSKKISSSSGISLDVAVRDALAEKVEKAIDYGMGALEDILFVPGQDGSVRDAFSSRDCGGLDEKFPDKAKRHPVIESCFRDYLGALSAYCEIAPKIKAKEVKQIFRAWGKGNFSSSDISTLPAGPGGAAFLVLSEVPALSSTIRLVKALTMCTRRVPFKVAEDLMMKFGRVFMAFTDETKNPDVFDDAAELDYGGFIWEALEELNKAPWTNNLAAPAIKAISKYVGSARRQTEMVKEGKWSYSAARTTAMANSAKSSKRQLDVFIKLLDVVREHKKEEAKQNVNKCAALLGVVPNLQVVVDNKKNHKEGFKYMLDAVESIISEEQLETGGFTPKHVTGSQEYRTQAMMDSAHTSQCMVALHHVQKLLASVKTTGHAKKEQKKEGAEL